MLRGPLVLIVGCGLLVTQVVTAAESAEPARIPAMPVPPAPVTAPTWLVSGQLESIDRIGGTATIRHPRLPIGVPAATTVFRVAEPMFLEQMKSARNVRFSAARVDGVLTITHLEVPGR